MAHRVCPWWLGYWLICPLRRRGQNPRETLAPHVHEGATVLEPGSGMGFFTLDLARLVGSSGRVIAVDIQPKMLEQLRRRATKAGLLNRVDIRLASPDSMRIADLRGSIDSGLSTVYVSSGVDVRHNRPFCFKADVGVRVVEVVARTGNLRRGPPSLI